MHAFRFIKGIAVLFLLWMSTLLLFRLIFVYRYFDYIDQPTTTLLNGIKSDQGILSIIIGISICFLIFRNNRNKTKASLLYFKILSFVMFATIACIEHCSSLLYSEWGSTLSYKAISYVAEGKEAWITALRSLDAYILLYIGIGITFFKILDKILQFFFIAQYKSKRNLPIQSI